jgi:hypothetical protein
VRFYSHEWLLEGSQGEGAGCGGPGDSEAAGGRALRRLALDPQALAEAPPRRKNLAPRPSPGRTPRILATTDHKRALWAQLEANDDATLERHCELWEERHGARVSVATMSRAVRKLGWTYKKSRWRPPNGTRSREALGGSA